MFPLLLDMSKPEIIAVHKQKLDEFLRKLELWESLTRGELKCQFCGVSISLDNIGFIIPSGQEILFCCFNSECICKYKELQRDESQS